jgi:hypothetical protein
MTVTAGKEERKRGKCLTKAAAKLERAKEDCFANPGCDYAETCVEVAKARHEDRAEACTTGKKR